jgi:glycerol-3-phosphate acyltransferase PlsY
MAYFSACAAALAAYLLGAIPFGLVLGRALRGVDIREHGSRNIGATNAYRVLGARVGIAVFALDAAKGLVPTLLARDLAGPLAAVLAAAAAIVGHVFPPYLGFRGGKGVATAAGGLFALAPAATGVACAVWVAVVLATRYVSLGSILAAIALPAAILAWEGEAALGPVRRPVTIAAGLMAVLVIARHHANILRLLRGTEPRVGARAPGREGAPPGETGSRVGP